MTADQHLRAVAASDERFAHLENLQIRHQEGPCIDAFDAKELVGVEDLERDARWPAFREAAVARGVRAVLASPVPYNQDSVGVVASCLSNGAPWAPEAELALLAFTDLAALLIASMMQGQQQSELTVQLQAALKSRQVIEQAKGVLVGRDGITPREAYCTCAPRRAMSGGSWSPSAARSSRTPPPVRQRVYIRAGRVAAITSS